MIRDQVVERCRSKQLRVRMLRDTALTLDKIVTMARAHEAAEEQARNIDRDTTSVPQVSHVRSVGHRQQFGGARPRTGGGNDDRNQPRGKCWRCNGYGHWRSECPAKDHQCEVCHRYGHVEQMCRSGKGGNAQDGKSKSEDRKSYSKGNSQAQGGSKWKSSDKKKFKKKDNAKVNCVNDVKYDDSETDYVFKLHSVDNVNLPVRCFEIDGKFVKCLIDSGATCNVVNESIAKRLNVKVEKCTRQLLPYESNECIQVTGKFNAVVTRVDRNVKAEFRGPTVRIILGPQTCKPSAA